MLKKNEKVEPLLVEAFEDELNKGIFRVNQLIDSKVLINMLFMLAAVYKVINKLCKEFESV